MMEKISTEWLSKHKACPEGRKWWRDKGKNPDSVQVLKDLISDDKLDWANWVIVRLMSHEQQVRYAIYAAEQVIEIYEQEYPNDDRPRKAIEAAKNYLDNPSEAAAEAAKVAWAVAKAAAWAAEAADAAEVAAEVAAWAADAARAAEAAAEAAAWAAAWAARAAGVVTFEEMLTKILNHGIQILTEEEHNG